MIFSDLLLTHQKRLFSLAEKIFLVQNGINAISFASSSAILLSEKPDVGNHICKEQARMSTYQKYFKQYLILICVSNASAIPTNHSILKKIKSEQLLGWIEAADLVRYTEYTQRNRVGRWTDDPRLFVGTAEPPLFCSELMSMAHLTHYREPSQAREHNRRCLRRPYTCAKYAARTISVTSLPPICRANPGSHSPAKCPVMWARRSNMVNVISAS